MASKYSLNDYDSEAERAKDPEGPSRTNLFAAANYMKRLLDANGVNWAVMGGFALICRGSRRNTRDLDIVTETTARKLWEIIEPQPRLIEGVIKVFVRTGPTFGDADCLIDNNIEVDLVLPGIYQSPENLQDLTDIVMRHQRNTHTATPASANASSLSIGSATGVLWPRFLYMMRTKLRHCTTRTLERDLEDIKFMLDTYASYIPGIRNQLDEGDLEFSLNTEWVREMDSEMEAHYRDLLGC